MSIKHRVKRRIQRNNPDIAALRKEVKALRKQVKQLTEDVQEARTLHERVAELTDAVAELLVPAVDRDDAKVKSALETFNRHYA